MAKMVLGFRERLIRPALQSAFVLPRRHNLLGEKEGFFSSSRIRQYADAELTSVPDAAIQIQSRNEESVTLILALRQRGAVGRRTLPKALRRNLQRQV
jgi:hypothetical protein